MSEFVSGDALTRAIKSVAKGAKLDAAVAFWGSGADAFLNLKKRKDWRVVCNLATGGSNPKAIRALEDPSRSSGKTTSHIKQNSRLHAKVYVSDAGAVIASANMSTNGLGFEGDLSLWIEAGVHLAPSHDDYPAIREWFETLWNARGQSNAISDKDLSNAEAIYKRRQAGLIGLGQVEMLDTTDDKFPLISWWVDEVDGEVAEGIGGDLRDAVLDGYEVEDKRDLEALTQGRWVLWWRSVDGIPQRETLSWLRLGSFYERAFLAEGTDKWEDTVLADLKRGPHPFELTSSFRQKFWKTLSRNEYRPLLHYRGKEFSARRLKLMQKLWLELQGSAGQR